MNNVYLLNGKRTPFCKFGGAAAMLSPTDLAIIASRAALETQNTLASDIDAIVAGNVVPSATDSLYLPKHLSIELGCRETTSTLLVNRLCATGLETIIQAARLIQLGEANLVLAVGSESMSMIPYVLRGARFGFKMGNQVTEDWLSSSLYDRKAEGQIGETVEDLARQLGITRRECDLYAFEANRKTGIWRENRFDSEEICHFENPRIGRIDRDETYGDKINLNALEKLPPIYEGVTTAGNATGLNDGAAAILIASESYLRKTGAHPESMLEFWNTSGTHPRELGRAPGQSLKNLLKDSQLGLENIDQFEINDAFSALGLCFLKETNADPSKVNPDSSAATLGHPMAATGIRMILSLQNGLKRRKGLWGFAGASAGGGQGIGVFIKRI